MEINEYKIRLNGLANISKDLMLEKDVNLTIKNAETTTSKLRPNHDGTADKIITIKITERSEIKILCENEILEAVKKKTQSQKLRAVIFEMYNQTYSGSDIEFEDFYTKRMSEIIDHEIKRLR